MEYCYREFNKNKEFRRLSRFLKNLDDNGVILSGILLEKIFPSKVNLIEVAPPSKKIEKFINDSKESFRKRYGKAWKKILYATAWKKYNMMKNSKK